MNFKNYILFILTFLMVSPSFGQDNNDCETAMQLCNKETIQLDNIIGFGTQEDLSNTCLDGIDKFSSIWFFWRIQQAGNLTFTLSPNIESTDLDFVIYKINSDEGCADKTVVRCMAAGESIGQPSEPCIGPTGLSEDETDVEELPGCINGNNNFLAALECLPGEEYVMLVNSFNQNGSGFLFEWGGTAELTCDQVSSLSDFNFNDHSIFLHPNPAHDFMEIEMPNFSGQTNCRIFDSMGRLVHTENIYGPKYRMDIADLIPGLYYLAMEMDGVLVSKRFLKG